MTDSDPTDWFPRHPRLRPDLRPVRRDDGRLQLGLRPDDRLVLPDEPGVAAVLRAVRDGRRPDLGSPDQRRWARALIDRGLVVDARALARRLDGTMSRPAVLAAYVRTMAEARLEARASARVLVDGSGPWAEVARDLLAEAGLQPPRRREAPTALLVLSDRGEAPRDTLDEWMRVGQPHLVVTNVAARVEIGPFVAPGLTACLRCVDEHGADHDPDHPLVVAQHGPSDDEPADPLLLRLALAWAVRDLLSYVEGDEPATWSTSVSLDTDLVPQRSRWDRHPRCGCAWGDALAAG